MADLTPADAAKQGLGWVDKNHPNYGKAGFVGSTPATASGAPGASPTGAPGSGTPGIPGAVDPALKNPAPATAKPFAPSPAPQIGLGNTIDQSGGQTSGSASGARVQAPGLMDASAQPAANPQAEMQQALRGQIMGMLGQNVNQASVTDADIAPESQAFAGAQERYGAARRAELAHQAARGGWSDSGGLDTRLDALSQQTAQAVGANDASLVARKLDQRRGQLNAAMQAAQALGMDDEANNLKRQLANLDASIQTRGQDITREQTGVQRDLANLDASTRIYLGDLNAKLQAEGLSSSERLARMDSELKKYGIDVQGRLGELDAAIRRDLGNRQIDLGYDTLGLDAAKTQAGLNRDAILAAMGG